MKATAKQWIWTSYKAPYQRMPMQKKSPGTFYGTQGPPMLANHHESIWSHFAMSQLHYILLIILTCSEYSRLIGFTSQISPRSRNHWLLGSDRPILSPLITYILINYRTSLWSISYYNNRFFSLDSAIKHPILKLERGGILHIVLTHYRIAFIASFFNSWYRRDRSCSLINRYGG